MDSGDQVMPGQTVIVKPLQQRGEAIFVFVSIIAVILVAAGLISLRAKVTKNPPLKSYQVSAFFALPPKAQSVFMDLYTSGFDIEGLHRKNETWPLVNSLEDSLMPPFEKNALWESRGKIQWLLYPMDNAGVHRAAYIGKSNDTAITGSFIAFFEHFHTLDGAYFSGVNKRTPFTIWYKPGIFILPKNFSEGTLIATGWHEAVPYRGADELKKLNRGN